MPIAAVAIAHCPAPSTCACIPASLPRMTAMWGILLYVAIGLAAVGAIKGAHRLREHARWLKRMGG